ncbi:glycine zipper family protein [Aliikangiella marina]|uniref:Glycine zipper family protein n=1 Tax=Aliikangiella marina TaxID=1712262 RepID=A0A545T4D8_9GAMM|nr:glycine zipper family protein [Aliikangiella marina]TQV72094.1 glycine zipper family protein [Aliikangiella marina]
MLRVIFVTVLSLSFLIITGCAHRNKPIVDTRGVDMSAYRQDWFECNQYAQQVTNKAGAGAVGGAVVGAAVGGIVGNSETAKKGAAVGALSGAIRGQARTGSEKSAVLKNCLAQRGYRVLN